MPYWRDMARAAIEAMREPTNEMHKAMCECYNSPASIWVTGINTALGLPRCPKATAEVPEAAA